LCANKIVQVGIKKVIYVEAYPQEEAKTILADVDLEPFEGVLYNGYFRFMR
jgi:deoxycytidylate deaminase